MRGPSQIKTATCNTESLRLKMVNIASCKKKYQKTLLKFK